MVQLVRAFTAKTGNLSFIPGTHTVEGENGLPDVTL